MVYGGDPISPSITAFWAGIDTQWALFFGWCFFRHGVGHLFDLRGLDNERTWYCAEGF